MREIGPQNANDIHVYIWSQKSIEILSYASRIYTYIHCRMHTLLPTQSTQLEIIGRSRRITTRSAVRISHYPRNNDYFVTPSRSVNSRGSLEIRS